MITPPLKMHNLISGQLCCGPPDLITVQVHQPSARNCSRSLRGCVIKIRSSCAWSPWSDQCVPTQLNATIVVIKPLLVAPEGGPAEVPNTTINVQNPCHHNHHHQRRRGGCWPRQHSFCIHSFNLYFKRSALVCWTLKKYRKAKKTISAAGNEIIIEIGLGRPRRAPD